MAAHPRPHATRRVPKLCLHKATGQAVVRLNGKDHYLGRFDSPESRHTYDRLIAEWLQRGRHTPNRSPEHTPPCPPPPSVNDLILAYWHHAAEYYRDAPVEREKIRLALRPLRELYGPTPAAAFGPLALRNVRQHLLGVRLRKPVAGRTGNPSGEYRLGRRTVNMRIGIIKRAFRWAASVELAPIAVHQALATVEGLKQGRSEAVEPKVVRPVPREVVEATLPHLGRHVRAMVRFQLHTGARSGEVCRLRWADVDTSNPACWLYRPPKHKTAFRGHDRVVFVGPKAQAVLADFPTDAPSDHIFSPARAAVERFAELRARRRCPVYPSTVSRRKAAPKRVPGPRYVVRAYRQAIRRACLRAGIAPWHPHQLRHAAATALRQEFGVETTRLLLGHRHLSATEIYAESNHALAAAAIAKVG